MSKPAIRQVVMRSRSDAEFLANVAKVLDGLFPMTFDERRRALRWACDRYGLEARALMNEWDRT